MIQYRVDVRPILEQTGASLEVSDTFGLDVLTVGDESFTLRGPASFDLTITNAGAGVVAHGDVRADVKAVCSRCLCEFDDVIHGEVVGFYTHPTEQPCEEEDAETIDPEGAIDLGPALLAALVIEAPFAPVHDEACAGLCPQCGADLNAGPCRCHASDDETHPFAGLKELLDTPDTDDPASGSGPSH